VTNDLFELVKDHADWTSADGVHFNGQGNEALAKQVAESVAGCLPANK
jgi:lysophospholipase L1-like esterase